MTSEIAPAPTTRTIVDLESVRCPICGVNDAEVVYPSRRKTLSIQVNEFRPSGDALLEDPLVRCRRCTMQYVNPRVPADLVLEGYASTVDETFASQVTGREMTFARCLKILHSVWRKPPGRLLDIGTAGGSFLKVAKDAGWEVAGCEPNRWLCQWCEEHYGIRLTPGTIFDGHYRTQSFDLITLWDVLEHTADPLSVLRECERLLAPGGLIAVNCPDIGSWIARLMGRRWVFIISVHNYYFTKQTFRLMLEAAGFIPITMRPHLQTLELDYILFRAEPLLGPVARGLHAFARATRVGSAQIPYWIGQTLVVARRQDDGAAHA